MTWHRTALVAAGAALACATPAGSEQAPTLAELVGQKLVVSMNGTSPSASLLRRVRRGEVGGVIVHRFNFGSAAQLRLITRVLQQAAAGGGHPKLLVAVDQEGGKVKTIPSAPPGAAPARMSGDAREQGRRTAAALLALGVNTDLAPVADVPASRASAVYRQGRTWSFDAADTARLSAAFALGLRDHGAVATMKHFPGLGFARRDTDRALVRIAQPTSKLAPGLLPYRRAIRNRVPIVMLSNAMYDAYDRANAAGWSRAVATALLRRQLGFTGVSMTDSLDGAARVRGIPPNALAIAAARAGTDLILLTGSEAATRDVYTHLLRAAQRRGIGRATLERSYARILALKELL
jgi:beta-N-acetylhexosaminidase